MEMRKKINSETFPKWLGRFERIHERNGNSVGGFFVGNKVSSRFPSFMSPRISYWDSLFLSLCAFSYHIPFNHLSISTDSPSHSSLLLEVVRCR